jgi:hypothetical protein
MDPRPRSAAARAGTLILAGGAFVLLAWTLLLFLSLPTLEEPASPGKAPNPSLVRWDVPVPAAEYSFARFLQVTWEYLPLAGVLVMAIGAGLLLVATRPGSAGGAARRGIGVLFLLFGVSLVGLTMWQWRIRTAPLEPFDPKQNYEIDPDSPFLQDFSKWTPHSSDAYFRKLDRIDRLDRLWWRSLLYVFAPAGALLSAAGLWLLVTRSPQPRIGVSPTAREPL